jgi:hypothetical protein
MADGKATLQTPAGVSKYHENQTKNYTPHATYATGRAMSAHARTTGAGAAGDW